MFRDFKKYEVYADGRIWSYKSNKWLKPTQHHTGYFLISLYDNDGQHKLYQHHRVVYESVTGHPIPEGMQVNHINEDKSDNRFENLNLMSPKENVNWGTGNERRGRTNSEKQRNHPLKSKRVEQYDKNGNLLNIFSSTREVQRQLGYNHRHISECCRGKLKTSYGFTWRFAS